MLKAIAAAVIIAAILSSTEYLRAQKLLSGEGSRKFAHILSGIFIAFLPFWMPYRWIAVLAVGFVVVNIFNHYFTNPTIRIKNINHKWLKIVVGASVVASGVRAINSVKRKTWGEVLFGVAILACAILSPAPWIFAAGVLQVAVADGLAALAGVYLGRHHGFHYKIFGSSKTLIGSWTFFISSLAVVTMVLMFGPEFTSAGALWPIIIWLPLLLTGVENLAVFGFDNLLLPLVTVVLLRSMAVA